jgi:YihY family inner membrane protein
VETIPILPEDGVEKRDIVTFSQRIIPWLVAELKWFLRVLAASCDRFYWDNGFSKAASLAYSTLLAIVPITALGFGFLASFAASKEHIPALKLFIFRQFAPSTQAVDQVINNLAIYSEKLPTLNVFVIAFIVGTSILLLNSVEYVLNEIWQVYEARSISHRIAIFCAIIVIAPVMVISAYYTMKFRVAPLLEEIGTNDSVNTVYNGLLGFLIDYIAFLALYYLVPKAPVRFASATFGSFVAALLFGGAKVAFGIYIVRFYSFDSYADVYGSTLAVVPIFLFWLYLSWTIVLLGAESCFQAQYLPKTGQFWKRSVLSVGDGKMVLAFQSLVIIARAFAQGGKLPNELDIAERLGCSSVVLKPALNELEIAEIIARGDSRDMPLTLMCDPSRITLEEIKLALFKTMEAMHYPREMMRLFEAFSDGKDTKSITLADVLKLDKEIKV